MEGGESSQTFLGMYYWVKRSRPPVVILENVLGADWDGMINAFEEINYSAAVAKVQVYHRPIIYMHELVYTERHQRELGRRFEDRRLRKHRFIRRRRWVRL